MKNIYAKRQICNYSSQNIFAKLGKKHIDAVSDNNTNEDRKAYNKENGLFYKV